MESEVYIRVDMNETIATGHVMRCLSIADAARKKGVETKFIVADNKPIELLEKKGYDYFVLNSKWDDMEGELPKLLEIIRQKKIKKLLIDSYQVTEKYLRAVTNATYTVYMDDLNLFLYPVNAIICYAMYHSKFEYQRRYCNSPYHTVIFEGCRYVPLRQEYMNLQKKTIKKNIEKLLILSGGTDHQNAIGQMLEVLNEGKYKSIDVVCGVYNERVDELKERFGSDTIQIHKSVENIHEYMKKADLAVSAGGTTLYELAACGTPTVTYALADNQLANVRQMEEEGFMKYIGDIREGVDAKKVLSIINNFYDTPQKRLEMSKQMQLCVDGMGTQRILDILVH